MGRSNFTLYLLGGSVPWGFPYAPRCSIGTIVSQQWGGAVRSAELVVRNEARYGAPSRYVLERARAIAQRTHTAGTALALVFSGHNEFLHLSPKPGKRGRGPALMSREERDAIVALHRKHVEASVLALRRAGIEVVLATLPSNMRDWPPSYTVLGDDRADSVEYLHSCAQDARAAGRTGEAAALIEEILGLDAECAQAHFLLGHVYLAAGRAADARLHLACANDYDGRPIRATSAINHNIRALAIEHDVRLLDAKAALEASAADGVCGNEQFWDDAHPKLEGYVRIAAMLSVHIAELAGVNDPPATPALSEIARVHGLDHAFLADLQGRIGLYCYKHSGCWDSEITLDLAEKYLREALSLDPKSVEVHVALALLLAYRGDDDQARNLARFAHGLNPQRALWLLHGREARSTLGALGITSISQWALGAAE